MFLSRSPALAVWLLAGGACCLSTSAWADDSAATGKLHPWVLLAIFWGAALLSVSVHYVLRYLAQAAMWARRLWQHHAATRTRLRLRARVYGAQAAALAEQGWDRGWDWARDAARRAWQSVAGARRAPGALSGALIGWSRSARKALRA